MATKQLVNLVELNKNKHFFSKEFKLKQEIEKLNIQLSEIKQSRGNKDSKDYIVKDIQNLIIRYKDKINELDTKNKRFISGEHNIKKVASLDRQIGFMFAKGPDMRDEEHYFENISKKSTGDHVQTKKENSELQTTEEFVKNEDNIATKTDQVSSSMNEIYHVNDFIERVNSELQVQKYQILNENTKYRGEYKRIEKKKKKLIEYTNLFERVIELSNDMSESKTEKYSQEEIILSLQKIIQELPNFGINTIKNLDSFSTNTTIKNLKVLFKNFINLGEKISNIQINRKSSISKTIIDMFKSNIILAKENNILLEKLLQYSNLFYNSTFNQVIENENPPDFNTLKTRISDVKNSINNETVIFVPEEEKELEQIQQTSLNKSFEF